jgi:hypothetical protein
MPLKFNKDNHDDSLTVLGFIFIFLTFFFALFKLPELEDFPDHLPSRKSSSRSALRSPPSRRFRFRQPVLQPQPDRVQDLLVKFELNLI